MKIIEGKQAVLKPYRTEKGCVLPREGRTALPLKLATCPVMELSAATCSSVDLSDAKIRRPVAYASHEIPDIVMREPIDCGTEMHKPVKCSTQEISDIVMRPTVKSATHIDDITIKNLQTREAQVIPATPELERMMEETEPKMSGLKKKKCFADTILHITNSK